MGMLATIINSLALQSALEDNGVKAKVLTSIRMEPIGEYYSKARAIEYLEAGYVVIVGGGTSNPYFTTDSASALRGIEIEADVMLKGTRVDGVYTADPEKDPAATKFDRITFEEVLDRRLKSHGPHGVHPLPRERTRHHRLRHGHAGQSGQSTCRRTDRNARNRAFIGASGRHSGLRATKCPTNQNNEKTWRQKRVTDNYGSCWR